jgi:DNA-directed RNA polymerase specialized sigma24 family protein
MASAPEPGAAAPFDEPAVRLLLAGGAKGVGEGVALIERHLGAPMCRWIGRRFPGLSAEDVADAWAETLLRVLRAARAGRFRPQRPLLPWLRRIAQARAVDLVRRRASCESALAALRQGFGRAECRRDPLPAAAEARDALALARAAIATLPRRQRLVVQAFFDHYPESSRLAALCREVSRRSGASESRAAVKRALREGLCKLRAFLLERGYEAQAG